jgi:hypothetical protein
VALALGGLRLDPSTADTTVAPARAADLPESVRSGLGLLTIDLRVTALPASGVIPLHGGRQCDGRVGSRRGHRGGLADRDALVSERLRIVVVDDHHLFRAGVRAELAQHLDVVGEAAAPAEAVAVIAETRPDASFSPRLAAFVLQASSAATQQDAPDELEALTPRER